MFSVAAMAALLISATSYADNPLQSQGRIEYGEGTNKVVFDANDLVNIDERMVSAYASLNDLKADIYGGTKTDGTVISTGLFDYRDQMDAYTANRIADLQEKYDALENSLGLYADGLKSQLQNYATRAETAATAAEQAYTDVSNAAAQVDAARTNALADVNTAKTNALSAVDTAKANAVATLATKEGELKTDMSNHESDLEGRLTSHKTTLAGQLDGYITTAQGLLSDTENARDEAAGTANTLTSAVTTINQYDDRLTDLEGKVLTPETLDNYYTKTQADGKFLTSHQSLSNYYTKTQTDSNFAKKTDIPSLSGYATQSWVTGKGYLTSHQSLSNYYTKTEVDSKVSSAGKCVHRNKTSDAVRIFGTTDAILHWTKCNDCGCIIQFYAS